MKHQEEEEDDMASTHRVYVGSVHSFEIMPEDESGTLSRAQGTLLKTFFISADKNLNGWEATWEGIKLDAGHLPGTPLVLKEDLEHPDISVQEMYNTGVIRDYEIDEEQKRVIVYVRITDASVIERIRSGELQYVSPAVIPRTSGDVHRTSDGTEVLGRTFPLHLAIVGDPAYGTDAAKMTHMCTGDGAKCMSRLRMMSASRRILSASDECVSRKIKIIKNEKPGISNEQAAAIAYSYCRKGNSKKGEKLIATLTPKEARRINASLARTASIMERISTGAATHKVKGLPGVWTRYDGIDVFVHQNESIRHAVKRAGCGCTEQKESTKKSIATPPADQAG